MSKPNKIANHESLQRMNYLYQAANLNVKSPELARSYSDLVLTVGKKAVQRLDASVKRTICKKCHCLLLPGLTCTVRVKKKKVQWKCDLCKIVKSFDCTNRNYTMWIQKNESVVDLIDYNNIKL